MPRFNGTRGRHGDQTHRRLLTLELVDRAYPRAGRQHARQEIDLRIVGRDHQNIGGAPASASVDLQSRVVYDGRLSSDNPAARHDGAPIAIAILERLTDQCSIGVQNGFGLLGSRLAVASMGNGRKAQCLLAPEPGATGSEVIVV